MRVPILLSLLLLQTVTSTPIHSSDVASMHVSPSKSDYHWNTWTAQHGRNYSTHYEYNMRRSIFLNNLDLINKHNEEFDKGMHNYSLGMNQFGDMTSEEWSSKMFGYNNNKNNRPNLWCGLSTCSLKALPPVFSGVNPEAVDWRTKGAVTPVKNQGQCGSCWAFSATGSMEGANFVKNGELVSLSEQQLVDCSGPEGDKGCFGGIMDSAFRYVIQNGGIDTESDYPYTAMNGNCSNVKAMKHAVEIRSFQDVPPNDEGMLENAVAQQPVSVAIEADQPNFQFYKSGVFDATCGTQLDHGVLVVGYDSDNGKPYWIVKNSWGTGWGNNGYIWMAKNTKNPEGQCGIAMQPSFPLM